MCGFAGAGERHARAWRSDPISRWTRAALLDQVWAWREILACGRIEFRLSMNWEFCSYRCKVVRASLPIRVLPSVYTPNILHPFLMSEDPAGNAAYLNYLLVPVMFHRIFPILTYPNSRVHFLQTVVRSERGLPRLKSALTDDHLISANASV